MLLFDLPLFKRALALSVAGALLPGALLSPARSAPRRGGGSRLAASSGGGGAARAASYLLGARDAIRVTVKDYPEFNVDNVVIPPDGVVSMPFYGTVRVGGKTTAQVEATLRTILLRELREPRVSVTITQFRDPTIGRVYLLGAVAAPGPIDIREGFRLTEVLAAIGGLGGRLEEKKATLTRAGQAPIALNLAAALAQPNSAANVHLRPDDVLSITAIDAGRIVIAGDVALPGSYEMHRNAQLSSHELSLSPRLSDVILAAGGLRPAGSASVAGTGSAVSGVAGTAAGGAGAANGAASTGLNAASFSGSGSGAGSVKFSGFLQRAGRRVDLNIEEALANVGGIYNIPLQANDFVTVETVLPPPPIRVFVDGFVGRAGSLDVAPGTRLLQVLTEAGGLTKTPDKVEASVRRGNTAIAVDLPSVLLNAGSNSNIELQAGDVVQIHEPEVIRVRVAGSVVSPGELRLRPNATLLQGLLEAGNLSIKPEDARLNVLRREEDGSQKIIPVDAASLLELRSTEGNIALREGDIVNVSPLKMQTIFVQGQVKNPGAIEVREGEGLIELLTRAGGPSESAALTRIAVERNGKTLSVDALDAVKAGKPLDFPMQQGDKVVVPENLNRVLVLEAVAKPGSYTIPERGRLTLADALGQAGGPSQKTKEIVLVRKVNGALQEIKFPIAQVRSGTAGQTVLQSGDAIYVPATVAKRNLLETLGSTLGLLRLFHP